MLRSARSAWTKTGEGRLPPNTDEPVLKAEEEQWSKERRPPLEARRHKEWSIQSIQREDSLVDTLISEFRLPKL